MKYIRTINNIINIDNFKNLSQADKDTLLPYSWHADTIEELCDEFVFIDEFFKIEHRIAYSLENALARCKQHNVDITTLRGAIWTDKGLQFVARMNSEGVLELL